MKGKFLCVGMGDTNKAVSSAIVANGDEVVAIDDNPNPELENFAKGLGIEIHIQPTSKKIRELAKECTYCIPTPGLPDSHLLYDSLLQDTTLISELDYAGSLTQAPVVAITGTNGKTTVVHLVCDALVRSGINATIAGNNEVPFSKAVMDNPNCEVFVVEASSFGLRNTKKFSPKVAAWLNFSNNHLDKHSSLKAYERAKAKIWERISKDDYWVANASDPVVLQNSPSVGIARNFGEAPFGEAPFGKASAASPKNIPTSYKTQNTDAVIAIAGAAGAGTDEITEAIKNFKGLPHRMEELFETEAGIKWFNDSKATTPHAVLAGLASLESTVLIAGGQDKSGKLKDLKTAKNIKAVVAIGEAAPDILEIFKYCCPAGVARDMDEAVLMAASFAKQADSILLSPGGASFDWYESYKQRGNDFKRAVQDLIAKQEVVKQK